MKLTPFENAVAGSAGSLLANSLIFPLDVIKTKLQVQQKLTEKDGSGSYDGVLDAFKKIIKSEGIQGLYSGFIPASIGTVGQSFAYFYAYGWVRSEFIKRFNQKSPSTAAELILGALAGALAQALTLPISVITTRQQTVPLSEKKPLIDTFLEIIKEENIFGLWRGFRAALILCVNPAITYGLFERFKGIILEKQNKNALSSFEAFFLGALSKTLATIVTYPYIMAKVRLQWRMSKSLSNKLTEKEREFMNYKSSWDVLKKSFQQGGILSLYTGLKTQIIKAVICQAILSSSKEQLNVMTFELSKLINQVK